MRPIQWVITALVVAVVLFVIAGVTPIGRGPFQSLFAIGEVNPIDFTKMASIRGPAQWLVCPGYEM